MKAERGAERKSAGQHQGAAVKNGWPWKPLGEVCKTGSGGTPLSSRKEYYEGGNIPWLLSGEVAQGNVREAKNFITKAGLENSAAKLFPKDTVLVAMYGATAGQVGILRFETATNQALCGILPNDKFVPEFLFYFLLAKKDELVAQATGNAQPNISQIKIKNTEVPVPPLAEQQRIVGLLDEAFEGLATAKANAEKNLQNARALFESHLQSVFTQRGPGWVETKLDDVTDLITCGVAKRPDYVPDGIPFLSAKNVKAGQVIWSGHQYVSEETHRALTKNNKPKIGDILYTRVGSYGEAAIIDRDVEFSIFVSLTLIKPKSVVLNSFLKHYLNSSAVKELAADSITGSGVGNLNVGTVREFPIHLPPLPEQRSIVSQLDSLREETQRLARLYERKLAALEALKKSLLHQAFTGEL